MCDEGFTGADCSQEDCTDFPTVLDGVSPRHGAVFGGMRVNVKGQNLDCDQKFECVFRSADLGVEVGRAPASVVTSFGLECIVPASIEETVYSWQNFTMDDQDLLEPDGQVCPLVPPLALIELEVVTVPMDSEPSEVHAFAEYTLLRCQPAAGGVGSFDFIASGVVDSGADRGEGCVNGGICSRGGFCVCAPGWCGAHCEVPANEEQAEEPSGALPTDRTLEPLRCMALHPSFALYHAYVSDDFIAPHGSDVEGLLAAGGDVTIGAYSVGELWFTPPHPRFLFETIVDGEPKVLSRRTDLGVGGRIVFTAGLVISGGNLVYRSNSSEITPDVAGVTAPGRIFRANRNQPFPVDFAGVDLAMHWYSLALSRLPRTGTSIREWSTLILTGTRPDVNIFHVSASQLSDVSEVRLKLTALSSLGVTGSTAFGDRRIPVTIINVLYDDAHTGHGWGAGDWYLMDDDDDDKPEYPPHPAFNVTWGPMGLTGDFEKRSVTSRILWNLPSADSVSLERIGVRGSILAPRAAVHFVSGEMEGQIWAKSYEGPGQVNLPMFGGACEPALSALLESVSSVDMSAWWASVGTPPPNATATGSGSRRLSSSVVSGDGESEPIHSKIRLLSSVSDVVNTTRDGRSWSASHLRPSTKTLLSDLAADASHVVGMYGAAIVPNCGIHGELVNGTCECYDPTWRRGRECQELCTEYCNGRGMCSPADQDMCECWNPTQWTGSRCQNSVCGENGILVSGGTNGVPPECACAPGFGGADGNCDEEIPCVFGTVIRDKCQCMSGWSGSDCTVPFPEPIRCYHGEIEEGTEQVTVETGPDAGTERSVTVYTCNCFENWRGQSCDQWAGRGSNLCYYGVFDEDKGHCRCDPFWTGDHCDRYTCQHGVVMEVLMGPTGAEVGVRPLPTSPNTGMEQALYASSGSNLTTAEKAAIDKWVTGALDEWPADGLQGSDLLLEDGNVIPTGTRVFRTLQDCRCQEGWYGSDCSSSCRGVCNFRGTACPEQAAGVGGHDVTTPDGASVQLFSGESGGSCQCDAPYTGTQCDTAEVPEPDGLEGASDDEELSASLSVSYMMPDSATETASSSSASSRRRLRRAMQDAEAQVAQNSSQFAFNLTQAAYGWRRRSIRSISGRSSRASEACDSASVASVVSGIAETRGETDELVACLPLVLSITRRTNVEGSTSNRMLRIRVRIPDNIRNRLNEDPMYIALASSTHSFDSEARRLEASSSDSCSGDGGNVTEAWRWYNHTTGLLTAIVCDDGDYHFQIMQPSVQQRALRPPWQEDDESAESGRGGSSGLGVGAIAGIVIGALAGTVLVLVALFFVLRHRARLQQALALDGGDAGGPPASSAAVAPFDGRDEDMENSIGPDRTHSDPCRVRGGASGRGKVHPEGVAAHEGVLWVDDGGLAQLSNRKEAHRRASAPSADSASAVAARGRGRLRRPGYSEGSQPIPQESQGQSTPAHVADNPASLSGDR